MLDSSTTRALNASATPGGVVTDAADAALGVWVVVLFFEVLEPLDLAGVFVGVPVDGVAGAGGGAVTVTARVALPDPTTFEQVSV